MSPIESFIPDESGPDVLLNAARPDLFRVNGFRITGLGVGAGAQAITRQVDRMRMAEKYGAAAERNGNGPLPLEPPPDADTLRAAIQRLRDPEIRLIDEFFWFWPQNPGGNSDDEALNALGRGEEDEAVAIWTKQEKQSDLGYIAIHNMAVLSHVKALDLEISHRFMNGKASTWIARRWRIGWAERVGLWLR